MKYKLKINLLASWSSHVIGILIGLFLMPFVLNTVGDDQYGIWLFICSIAGYSGLMNLGFGNTVSRFVAHHHAKGDIAEINRVVNVTGAVYLVMGTVVLALSGVLAWLAPVLYDWGATSDADLRWVIFLLGANVVVGMLGSVFGGVIIGLQRIDVERGINTVSGLVRLGLTVFFLKAEHGLVTLAVIFLLTTVVENLGYLAIVFRSLPALRISREFLSLKTLKECFGFSVYALLDNLAARLIDATDTIVIGIAFGSRYIVPYYVAHRLMTFVVQPLQMIGFILMPRGAELGANEQAGRLRALVQKGLGVSFLLTGGFFIGAYFFGDFVIQTWIGHSYAESHLLLLILLGAQVIATPMRVLRGVLFGMGHVQIPSVLYFGEALANLVLTLLLLKPLGLAGVALGTAIPIVVVELSLMMPYALGKLNYRWVEFLRGVLVPQLLPLAALWAYSAFVCLIYPMTAAWIPVLLVSGGGGFVLAVSWLVSHYATRRWYAA